MLSEISPKSGNELSIRRVNADLQRLYNIHFDNSPDSTVGRKTSIYSFPDSSEPIINTAQPIKLAVRYVLTKDVKPTAEVIDFDEGGVGVSGEPIIPNSDGGLQSTKPLAFPLIVDELAERMESSTEELEADRDE